MCTREYGIIICRQQQTCMWIFNLANATGNHGERTFKYQVMSVNSTYIKLAIEKTASNAVHGSHAAMEIPFFYVKDFDCGTTIIFTVELRLIVDTMRFQKIEINTKEEEWNAERWVCE